MTGTHEFSLHSMLGSALGDARERMDREKIAGAPPPFVADGEEEDDEDKKDKKSESEKEGAYDYGRAIKVAGALKHLAQHIDELTDPRSPQEKVAEAVTIAGLLGYEKVAVDGAPMKDAGNAPAALTPPKDPPMGKGLQESPAPSNALQNTADDPPGGGGEQPYKSDKSKTMDIPTDPKLVDPELAAGSSTTALETDDNKAPGGNSGGVPTAGYPEEGPIKEGSVPPEYASVLQKMGGVPRAVPDQPAEKTSQVQTPLVDFVLHQLAQEKTAEDAINPAKVAGGKGGTTVDGGDSPGTQAEEGVPSEQKPSEASMVSSNQSAVDVTKRDAKANQKEDLKKVLDEPPLSKATDSKLHENVTATDQAGAKIAADASREYLRRLLSGEGGAEKEAELRSIIQKLAAEAELPIDSEVGSTLTAEDDEKRELEQAEHIENDFNDLLTAAAREQGEEAQPDSGPAVGPDVPATV